MTDFRIWVVDDDEDDYGLIVQVFEELNIQCGLEHLKDGQQLLDRLLTAGTEQHYPNLVLLDINMPKVSGIEALETIRNNNLYKHIPIIMHTTSNSDEERKRCMELGANTFITKGSDYRELLSFVLSIGDLIKTPVIPAAAVPVDNRGIAGH